MGSGNSKSLAELDAQEVSNAIAKLGKNYDVYADTSRDNGVDGTLLAGLTEQEFRETLDDLGITNRLHRRVFVKAFDAARQQKAALSTAMTKFYERLPETFGFSRATSPEELMAFDEIAQDAMYQCSSPSTIYAGVHLVTDDGQLSLASLIRDMNGNLKPTTAHNTEAMSMCAAIVKYEQGTTFTKRELWENLYLPEQGGDKQWYTGHVVMDEGGNRIGMVCIVDKGDGTGLDEGDRMLLLQQLAADAEYQLKLRLVLLERKLLLEHQIQQQDPVTLPALQPQSQQDVGQEDAVVLPANGLLKPVLQSQLDRRPNDFPSPEDVEKSGKNRVSHELPAYNTGLASQEELYHLKKGFFDTVDSLGDLAQRPPIGKNDRERVAVVEALQLHQIAPNGEMAGQLKKLVFMALNLVGFSYGAIQFLDHEYQFSIAGVGGGTDVHACLDKLMKTEIVDNGGKPWLRSMSRDMAICNYPILSKRTFVIHDISKDDTFRWVAQMTPFLAYVGAPVINASGHVIATLCLFDTKIRNDFCKANEIQVEQLAQMVLQSIENWSLRRDIMRLERERMMFIAEGRKAEPPKDTATMVITDVQESTSLWEANASAMQEAIDCHDKVMRHFSTKYHGYEVDTEGDSFIFSFHDAIDAFRFALDVQRALFDAPWSKDLLTLGEACDDPSSSFRGLRVKIGIHTGLVRPINNCVTGRVTYSGETIAMAKNLESMSHGGQIISTFETWNSASYLAESVLDSPQVIDLGTHVVNKGGRADDGVIIKRIVQLVPASLSFNYFAARRHVLDPEVERPDQQSSTFHGRQFPPIKSKQQVSSSFHDAPYLDQKVTIAFLYTSEIEKRFQDNDTILASLNRLVGGSLTGTTGYQCQHNMLAFPDPLCAIKFGLHLLGVLESREPDLSKLIKIGLVHDTYLSMGPHHTTGRADYFGTVVNRAARVMSVAEIGTVCVGVGAQAHAAPIADPSICTRLVGVRMLKGVHEEIAIYECSLKSRR